MDGFDDLLAPSRDALERNPFADPFADPNANRPPSAKPTLTLEGAGISQRQRSQSNASSHPGSSHGGDHTSESPVKSSSVQAEHIVSPVSPEDPRYNQMMKMRAHSPKQAPPRPGGAGGASAGGFTGLGLGANNAPAGFL